jgi:hypothetical protein
VAISFIGAATASGTTDAATSFTVNKHASTATGDLMLMSFVGAVSGQGLPTVTLSGWNRLAVHSCISDNISVQRMTQFVYYRIAQSGDTSWTGTSDKAFNNYVTVNLSYRGVDTTRPIWNHYPRIGDQETVTAFAAASLKIVDPNAWWVAFFGSTKEGSEAATWTCSAGTERADLNAGDTLENSDLAAYDSNGAAGAGTVSLTGTRSISTTHPQCWVASLNPA